MTPDKLPHRIDEKKGAPARVTTRLAIGTPAALGVLLLAGAVALGHTSGFFASARDARTDAAVAQAPTDTTLPSPEDVPEPKPAEEGSVDELQLARGNDKEAAPDPTPKPAPVEEEPKPEPQPEPEVVWQPEPPKQEPVPQPAPPAPVTTSLALSANLTEHPGKVVLGWSAFSGDGFGYYKLVRSHDAVVTWPTSADDELIGAFGSPAETWAKDRPACGATWTYAVFAVTHGEYGHAVLASSNTVSATLACPPPPPPTSAIGLEVGVVEGAVHLSWGACASEHFNAYKVVRSQTNPDPTYPENDGTQLIAAIGDPNQTTWLDGDVASGQTWFYRVFARADSGGGNYIACASPAMSVTIP